MSDNPLLFDEFQRTDTTPARYTESVWEARDRLAWKNAERIRGLLEEWFVAYPVPHNIALQRRFRSQLDSAHRGAFFELFLFQFFTRLDCAVTVHPKTRSGVTPDFFAGLRLGGGSYVEATVVEPETFQDSPAEKVVFDGLNKLNCQDFWLGIETEGVLTSTPPGKMMQDVQAWIDELDYEAARAAWDNHRQMHSRRFQHEQWTIRIDALPRSLAERERPRDRPIGFGPMRGGVVDSAKCIRDAIHKKARQFKAADLRAPLIVAVDSVGIADVDRIDVLLALFGWEASTGEPDRAKINCPFGVQRKSWLWDRRKNTRISAVLLFDGLQPHTMASAPVCLYENPWATHPVPASLRRLPHAIVECDFIRWHPGETLGAILGFPADWPGPR